MYSINEYIIIVPSASLSKVFTYYNKNKTSKTIKYASPVKMCGHRYSPRARGVLFVLKGPYDPRVPPIVKFSQESESARLTKIILSKSTVKAL